MLTKAEKDFIRLVKKGLSLNKVASFYGVKIDVVERLKKSIYAKLKVKSLVAMVTKFTKMQNDQTAEEAAREEWEELHHSDVSVLISKEKELLSWEYFLKGFKCAEKKFRVKL